MDRTISVKFFSACLLGLVLVPMSAYAAAPKLEVSGWMPYWRVATSTADVAPHLDQLTEINPFAYSVKNDGTFKDLANLTQDPWASLIASAKAKHVRVVPTVMWSDGNAIDAVLRDPEKRHTQEDLIVAIVKGNGFDGIDLDYEGKLAETKDYFSLFLKELYKKMGNKLVECTIEARTPTSSRFVVVPKDLTFANDYTAINKYCDRVRIMTYDQGTIDLKLNDGQTSPYTPIADPAWVEKVVRLAMQSINKNKIEIGVATYGYEYTVTPLVQQGFRYDLQWTFNPKYATELARSLSITPQRNRAGELSFTYVPTTTPNAANAAASIGGAGATGTPLSNDLLSTTSYSDGVTTTSVFANAMNILWWSDSKAIASKVALAKKLGVRGIAIFKLDGGEDQALWSVLPKVR